MDHESKAGVAIKQLDDEGSGLARIATLSAIDSDGDTYARGAFGEQTAKVLASHNWMTVPLGKARVFEDGDAALAEFRMNLESPTAKEWHAALKFDLDAERSGGQPLQEWSYGFHVKDSSIEQRDGERIRVLKRLDVFEISPVVLGAGVGTATLDMKHGRRGSFAEQLADAIEQVRDVHERAKGVVELRAKEGRELSGQRRKELDALKAAIDALAETGEEIDGLVRQGDADPEEAVKQLARFQATATRISRGGRER